MFHSKNSPPAEQNNDCAAIADGSMIEEQTRRIESCSSVAIPSGAAALIVRCANSTLEFLISKDERSFECSLEWEHSHNIGVVALCLLKQ
ncbi:uncharacterized protein MONOS_16155 [Monocercomonoides exilis]|uniref:uncharacterized protein n=1 Tax=Monocercomonoides exilis TaxID=2049356 RepID=UPI00355AAF9C|nr:hypothetical protein MONOS_16155 [Monocercomonoides exilis]|eukprot:MONOS_16155.1-p1 / transcript=MONOS_16155.1 / gene=MONOS_16155 / organism=Monocercomonoides_exilis_PA203 / gene_product=unspecified product / transcript_product=unspecified product / location=Mono_scaffold01533:84-353(-) / protein_length=90 / sequence_SO=supercontig / SO=protein_coding / is_pseudo=false